MPRDRACMIDGRRWLSVPHAARLLATSATIIRRLMGEDALEWCQHGGGALLVAEDGVLRLRHERGTYRKEVAARTAAPLRTARQRGTSLHDAPRKMPTGAFDRTWDPLPVPAPVSGREKG